MEEYARVTSLLRNDLEGHLVMLLVEASSQSPTPCDDFAERFAVYPAIRVLHLRLRPDTETAEIESVFNRAINEDVDIALVWTDTARNGDEALPEDTAPYRSWPHQALAAAESVNLFERCLVALVGDNIQQQEARRLGYEDGFMASTSPDSLVIRLARDAVARREARRHGSSPPCFL